MNFGNSAGVENLQGNFSDLWTRSSEAYILKPIFPNPRIINLNPNLPMSPLWPPLWILNIPAPSRVPRSYSPKNPVGVTRKWRYFLLISYISLSHAYLTGIAFRLCPHSAKLYVPSSSSLRCALDIFRAPSILPRGCWVRPSLLDRRKFVFLPL